MIFPEPEFSIDLFSYLDSVVLENVGGEDAAAEGGAGEEEVDPFANPEAGPSWRE